MKPDEYEGETQDPRCSEEGCDGIGSHRCIVRALREDNARLKRQLADAAVAEHLLTRELAAALERDKTHSDFMAFLKTEKGKAAFALDNGWPLPEEVAALRQRVEELEREAEARPDPEVWRKALDTERARTVAAEAEVKRLRDIISPGDAAAYEEGMAALQAEVKRCYETLEEQREVNDKAWAEVARLEGLILDWYEREDAGYPYEYRDALRAEARRIRTQREEGLYHSHTCDLHPEEQCQACEGTGATGAGVPCCNRERR